MADIFTGSIRAKAPYGENGAWAYPGTLQIFRVPPIISATGKATNFKFGRYIHRIHPRKSPLKFWRKVSGCLSRDFPNFLKYPLLPQTRKATIFKFCTHIHTHRSEQKLRARPSPLKIWGKVAVESRTPRNFSRHPYIGRIARSSLR